MVVYHFVIFLVKNIFVINIILARYKMQNKIGSYNICVVII